MKVFETYEDDSKVLVSGTNRIFFDYDLDKIYNEKEKLMELIESGMSGYLIDEMIHT